MAMAVPALVQAGALPNSQPPAPGSRVAYAEIKKSERKASAVTFLKAAVIYYAKLGVRVQRVMTDNGFCYKSRAFGRACKRLGL